MAGLSSISGLIAGFDTNAAVDELLGYRKFEIDRLTSKQTAETEKQAALGDLNTLLTSFRTVSTSMKDVDQFFSYTASLNSDDANVPASSLLDVTGDNSVEAGSHTMVVNQLANAARSSSSSAVKDLTGTAVALDTTALNLTGSFSLNGTQIDITSADSLKDIAADINSRSIGVTASVIKVTDSDYRLTLAADSTGKTGFSLTGADLNSGGALANLQLGSVASSAAVVDSVSAAVSSDTTALGLSGTFQINGTNVTVNTTDSLQNIASTITSGVAGVTATVQTVGTSDLRLVLMADATTPPTNNTITVTDPNTLFGTTLAGLNLTAGASATNVISSLQQAQDSQVTIDGLAITRSSNTISDALSGVTLTLRQANAAVSVNMTVGVDTADVRSKVQDFVDSYNELYSFVNSQFEVNQETGDNGILAGEPLLRTIQSSMSASLLQNVNGLASDRNTLVEIGVEPDQFGNLTINEDRFSNFLNNNPDAIRDLFVVQGSSTTSGLQFLVSGTQTSSGSYDVSILSTASQASLTGTVDLVAASLAQNQTVTITETGNSRQSVVDLAAGDFQSDIISKLNTAFALESTEIRLFDVGLTDTGNPATSGSLFSNLGASVVAGDTISITGTNRLGVGITSSFTILDPTRDTIFDLLSTIQSAFGQQVTATVDASGRIQVEDNSAGDSQLSVTLTANNEGGGSLGFGVDTTSLTTEGRFPMNVEAVVSGNNIMIRHKNFGSTNGFAFSQSVDGLGIADNAGISGTDIVGTIDDATAVGKGQLLVSTEGTADGIGLLYSGNATAPFTATLDVGMGVAAAFDQTIDLFSNPFTGFVQNTITSSQDTHTSLAERILDLESQMERQRVTLSRAFFQMESAMNVLQGTGSFLTQQIDAMNSSNR